MTEVIEEPPRKRAVVDLGILNQGRNPGCNSGSRRIRYVVQSTSLQSRTRRDPLRIAFWEYLGRHTADRHCARSGREPCIGPEPELGGTGWNFRHATSLRGSVERQGFGRPIVAYHYLDAGEVLG